MSSHPIHPEHKPLWIKTVKPCGKKTKEQMWGAKPQ